MIGLLLACAPDDIALSDTPLTTPYSRLPQRCAADPACAAAVADALRDLAETIPASGVRDDVEVAMDLVNPYVREDPRNEIETSAARACQQDLLDWFDDRDAVVARGVRAVNWRHVGA